MFLLSMICGWIVEARNSSGGGGLRIFITHKYDRVDYLKFSLMTNEKDETMDELFQQFIKLITQDLVQRVNLAASKCILCMKRT